MMIKNWIFQFFFFIKEDFIEKITNYLSDKIKRPISIGIAGETASGKSTFTFDLISAMIDFQEEHALKPFITRINSDDYYYDRSEMVKAAGSFTKFAKDYDLDVPDAFELDLLKHHIEQLVMGNDVWLPKYDMSGTAKRYDNFSLAKPSKIIISEGLFTLTDKVIEAFDLTIYVHVDQEVQKERWFMRANDRNLVDAQRVFDNAIEKAKIHIKPTAQKADIIINGNALRKDYKNLANKFIQIVKEMNFLLPARK